MRALTSDEEEKIKLLTKNQVSITLLEPTATGLKKSIMDATGSVRSYLKEQGVHDFDLQGQGTQYKVVIGAKIYGGFDISHSSASLYRPMTKKGDPRIWFSGLKKVTAANDIICIIYFSDEFHVFNLTQIDLHSLLATSIFNPLKELIETISGEANLIAVELLGKLRKIATAGPLASMVVADTSVGRTLEKALGIDMNSSKKPDYKGIELKSFRKSKTNRKNLFAQVPNWRMSKFKSSTEILNAFGYHRDQDFKLYCTVSAITRNSQGLSLRLDSDLKQVIENSHNPEIGDFVVWTMEKLHSRLNEKHKETFWIEANSIIEDGKEYFQYALAEHTKKPILSQFDLLLDQGIITLDHLIKRSATGRGDDKGPFFKIKPKGIELLFPPSEKYHLVV